MTTFPTEMGDVGSSTRPYQKGVPVKKSASSMKSTKKATPFGKKSVTTDRKMSSSGY